MYTNGFNSFLHTLSYPVGIAIGCYLIPLDASDQSIVNNKSANLNPDHLESLCKPSFMMARECKHQALMIDFFCFDILFALHSCIGTLIKNSIAFTDLHGGYVGTLTIAWHLQIAYHYKNHQSFQHLLSYPCIVV